METKRLPLPQILATRDAAVAKDGLLSNCYEEATPIGDMIVQRPGYTVQNSFGIGCAQGGITYDGQAVWIIADTLKTSGGGIPTLSSFTAVTTVPKPTGGQFAGKSGYLVSHLGDLYGIGGSAGGDASMSVYKSTNNGVSWSTISTPWASVVQSPMNAAVSLGSKIYACGLVTANGVYSSPDGVTWALLTADLSSGSTRTVDVVIIHNNQLYAFLSGNAVTPQIWRSSDGITWTAVNSGITGLTGRIRPGFVSLNNRLYIIGGGTSNTSVNEDVWTSSDNGSTWVLLVNPAGFGGRVGLASWVSDGRMWIGGGATAAGFNTPTNSVWSSADGSAWLLAAASSAWSARHSPSFTIHSDRLYIGAGVSGSFSVDGLFFATAEVSSSVTLSPAPATSCLPFQMTLIPATLTTPTAIFLKNSEVAYYYNGLSVVQITDSDYPTETVYGVVYLDGYIFVMNRLGVIYNSDLGAPTSWSALSFISANSEADAAVALVRQLNYVVAFKAFSTEFFYDAGNASGSPLAKVLNALLEVGCASSGSIAFSDNTIYFMSASRQKGRSIMKMEGYTPKYISNQYIDRILNADSLEEVYAFVVKTNGHFFYVLTLVDTAITLVLDEVTGKWHRWTHLTADSPVSILSLEAQSDGSILATTVMPHSQSDGNVVDISGATPIGANGQFNLRYDSTVHANDEFSYVPDTPISGAITGTITATFYTESFFPGVYYAKGDDEDLLLDISSGDVYNFSPTEYQDDGQPINVMIRTILNDFGVMATKRYSRFELVGDRIAANVLVRFSDNDYESWSLFRAIPMDQNRAKISNLGSGRRRAFELRKTANTELRLLAAEIDFDVGAF